MASVDILLPKSSQYHVLHHFSRKIHEALLRLGYDSHLVPERTWSNLDREDYSSFSMGFNGAPSNKETGEYLPDAVGIPHVALLVDPPYRFLKLRESPYIFTACDDKSYAIDFKTERYPYYYFFPHGVEPDLRPDPLIDKLYEVTLLATFIDPEEKRSSWPTMFSPEISQAMEAAIDITLSDDTTSFVKAFQQVFNELLKEGIVDPYNLSFPHILSEIELYIKGIERISLVKAIKDVPVHIFGGTVHSHSWERYFSNQANVVIHPSVEFPDAVKIIKQSKIVLNSSLKNKFGAHERVFASLALETPVVTSDNPFIRETFTNDYNILLYQYRNLDALNDKIVSYISDEEKRKTLGVAGREIVMKHHTWDQRLQNLFPQVMPHIQKLF